MPITPLIGVRISWLIIARKAALVRTASSASSFALRRSSINCICRNSVCFLEVISRKHQINPKNLFWSELTGLV